uniref:DNA-directed RNA polymerases I, II, and III subunit RPABC4 n=1 Tax=Amphimedon queenslandica TaxID=400682 RepID=A0A1X7VS86_AMPQE
MADSTPGPGNTPGASSSRNPVIYICGECHGENEIRPRDPIRCTQCGYRILYKKRTKRIIVFDAR